MTVILEIKQGSHFFCVFLRPERGGTDFMRQERLWCIWILMLCLCAGCSGRMDQQNMRSVKQESLGAENAVPEDAGNSEPEDEAENSDKSISPAAATNERMTSDGELQGITIRIYHSDEAAEHICVNTALTEKITPEILLLNLSSYGMIPEDVKVESFSAEKGETRRLTLDLSPDFSDYLNSMGTSGEYLVMGSLVNTFLDAYNASAVKVTAGGAVIETGHQIYDGWLEQYDYVKASYSVSDGLLQKDKVNFCYPQLQNCTDTELQEKWNRIIKEKVESMAEELKEGASLYGKYDIKTMNDELLSILFSGDISNPGVSYSSRFQFTYNIDMKTGESIRLAHYRDVDQIAEDMMNGKNYTVSGELASEFQARLTVLYGDARQLAAALRGFDFGKGQEQYPGGYSWQEDGKTWLSIEVPHALGDYVNVELQ